MEGRVGRAFQRSGRLCQHPMFSRSLEINTKEESRRFSIRLLGEPNNLRDCFDFCLLYHLGVFEFPSENYFNQQSWISCLTCIVGIRPQPSSSFLFQLDLVSNDCSWPKLEVSKLIVGSPSTSQTQFRIPILLLPGPDTLKPIKNLLVFFITIALM